MNEIIYVGKHKLTKNVAYHMHDTWEIIYYTSGEGQMIFDDCTITYKEGNVIVIPPNFPHSNHSENGFTNIFVNLANSNLNFHSPIKFQSDAGGFMYNAFSAAWYHYNEDVNRDALLTSYGHLLVGYIHAFRETPIHSDIVEEIRSNIIQNFSDSRYELDQFLRSLPFSYDYLRKLFKKEMGMTPHQYLCEKRLDTAAEWLSSIYNDNDNIADVARLCGFNEPLYFSRMFKKRFGVAPSYYRNEQLQPLDRLEPDQVKIQISDSESA